MASSAPLPPGWEARWDPNQRAFFYIDHSTKKTSWQDPRIGYQQPQAQQYGGHQQPFGHQHHQQAAMSLNPQTNQFASTGHGQNIAMATKYKQFGSTITSTEGDSDEDFDTDTDFDQLFTSSTHEEKVDLLKLHTIKQSFPSAPEEVIKEKLKKYNNVQVKVTNDLFALGYKREAPGSHPPPRADDMVQRLKAMFPTAADDIVGEILRGAGNDESQARATLETLGFKKVFPETHRSTTPNRHVSPSRPASSSNRTTSPARRQPSPKPQPAKPPSPAKPKLSEAEKTKMERKIHGQFPSYDMSVVKMALQVCNYDETRVKAVLERMGETSLAEGRKAPPSRPGTSKSRTRSPSPKPLSLSNLEPVSIIDDSSSFSSRPSTSTSTGRGTRSHFSSKSSVSTRPTPSKSTVRVPSPKRSTPQARAKKVTDTRQSRLAISRQPQRSEFTSEHRTEAKGHDPTLCVGPDKNLLIIEYTQVRGPNPELRQGPDPSRVRGSQGAMGPDRSLHCGPDSQLNSATRSHNVLVTAI